MAKGNLPSFARRLKELRDSRNLTQQRLAELAGIHKLTVAKLEQGIREPTWETVVALAHALGVSCEAFLQEPSAREPTRPGRPPKVADEPAPSPPAPAPLRPKGKAKGGRRSRAARKAHEP